MRFFSEHACSEKNRMLTLLTLTYMFRFQVHVDMHSPVCGHTSNNSQYELSLMINARKYGVVKSCIQWQLGYKLRFCGTSL
jgi:hypothetical protein